MDSKRRTRQVNHWARSLSGCQSSQRQRRGLRERQRLVKERRRADVLYVTQTADSENSRPTQSPTYDLGEDVCRQALPPPDVRQNVASYGRKLVRA